MKLSGFTIVRNISKFDYPAVEAITSILPVCDEIIVAVGDSEDDTLDRIRAIHSPKIHIIESPWNPRLRTGGHVLADQTNLALRQCSGDWCFYIQADEVLHEQYLPLIRPACEAAESRPDVEGFLFSYLHFWGSYGYYGTSRRWYRKETRIVRNHSSVHSFKDAQGFRLKGQKLRVLEIPAVIYHYGWVRPPEIQQNKQRYFHSLWHPDEWIRKHTGDSPLYDYSAIDALAPFTGTHPSVMQERIRSVRWQFTYDAARNKLSLKNRLLHWLERKTGFRLGEYKNYRLLKSV